MIQVVPWRIESGVPVQAGPAVTPKDWQFTDLLGEPGSGSVTFNRADPIVGLLGMDGNDLLQFVVNGVPVWVLVPDPAHVVLKSRDEQAGRTVTLSGLGLLGLLDRMKVFPAGGTGRKPKQQDRVFGWASPDYDISGLDTAQVMLLTAYAKLTWAGGTLSGAAAWAEDFPLDGFSVIYWADNPGGNTSSYLLADPGDCWFFRDAVFPRDGIYRFVLAADDHAEVLIDGQPAVSTDTYLSTTTGDVHVTAGTHRIAIHGRNGTGTALDTLPGAYVGPGGFSLEIAEVTLIGLNFIALPSTDLKVIAYEDAPPGVASVSMLLALLDENETAGSIPIARSFTATADSGSNAWDTDAEPVARIGSSLLDVVRSLPDAEFVMSPDLEADGFLLHAYQPGGLGSLVETAPKVEQAESQRENLPVTVLLVETADTWLEVEDEDAVTAFGRTVGVLSLGVQVSDAEAERLGLLELASFARQREEIGQTVFWQSEYPWVFPGDRVPSVEDSTGTVDEERLQQVAVGRDGDRMVVSWSFRDVVLGAEERQALSVWAEA